MLKVMQDLARVGWGRSNSGFRQVFTDLFFPNANDEIARWWNELQRISTSPENAVCFLPAFAALDVTGLAPRVLAPTLVLHCRDDRAVQPAGGQELATLIPDAQYVEIPGKNHLLLATDPGWGPFVAAVRAFLSEEPEPVRGRGPGTRLSAREHEVLALVAQGLSNTEIAARMFLSARTVERHLSNVYAKLGVSGKAARAAAAAHSVRSADH
jgi:DNA-binding CsgD family transcriptional regulator